MSPGLEPVRELAELEALAAGLPHRESLLLRWCAQDLRGGSRAFSDGEVSVAATPQLCRHDRFCIVGPIDAQPAAYQQLAQDLPGYLLGTTEQVEQLVAMGAASEGARWLAMSTRSPVPGSAGTDAAWMPAGDDPSVGVDGEVAGFLSEHFPGSYTQPGMPGVSRWLVSRDEQGAIRATAADCWSAPSLGYLGGVAVATPARGQGIGRALCIAALQDLLGRHGQVWLFADTDNPVAVSLYDRLGLDTFGIAAATFVCD